MTEAEEGTSSQNGKYPKELAHYTTNHSLEIRSVQTGHHSPK